jgi:hypothetical protein
MMDILESAWSLAREMCASPPPDKSRLEKHFANSVSAYREPALKIFDAIVDILIGPQNGMTTPEQAARKLLDDFVADINVNPL